MTKRELIDLIKHKMAGGDCPQELKGKYHPEIIAKHISIAMNHAVSRHFQGAANRGVFDSLDAFTKSYAGIEIGKDSDRGEYYAEIPAPYMSLPKNRGVRMVYPDGAPSKFFRYRENNRTTIFSNLDVDTVGEYTAFYVEGSRVWFWNINALDHDKVTMKIVQTFDSLDAGDYVPIPEGYEKIIFDLVVESMAQRPEKMTNDENSNTI